MYDLIANTLATRHLDVIGGFHPSPDEPELAGLETVLLLGPSGAAFWDAFVTEPEFQDGTTNPVDRWSSRVITALAVAFGATPFFPFSGPPYAPFFQWALRTQRCHQSPINLLVHDTSGLFVSFRGALGFRQRLDLPAPSTTPCETCTDQPCRTACPVSAFDQGLYDVPACKQALRATDPAHCLEKGCAARRLCPVSQTYNRQEAQSAYHMKVFLENGT